MQSKQMYNTVKCAGGKSMTIEQAKEILNRMSISKIYEYEVTKGKKARKYINEEMTALNIAIDILSKCDD
jgi:hypothetical protein